MIQKNDTYDELARRVKDLEEEASKFRETEKALKESQERLELVLEATTEGVWDWDIVQGKTYASRRCGEIFGVSAEQGFPGLSESWASRIHPDDYDQVRRCLEAHLEGNGSFDVLYRHRHESGEYRWQEAKGVALFDKDGNAYRMVGTIQDVTEKKHSEEEKGRLEDKLQQARKIEALGTLANGIAHDFNNLLTAILGNIELSHMYAKGDEGICRNLDKAKTACWRARDLTRQVITFAKGIDPQKRTASMGNFIHSTAEFVLSDKVTRCEFSLSEDLWAVDYDVEQMRLVMSSLLINASESMDGQGIIEIRGENLASKPDAPDEFSKRRRVRISIRDHGKGMDPEMLAKIFDPYFSSKSAATQKGMGLGLAICYSIVDKHGGHIEVTSQVDKGTTFHIYLPAA